jgi:hypothetical protein
MFTSAAMRMEFRIRPALPFVRMHCLLTRCAPRFGFAHCTGALLKGAHFSGILSVPCFEIPPDGGPDGGIVFLVSCRSQNTSQRRTLTGLGHVTHSMFIKGTDSALFACESRRAESDASRSHVRRIRAITSELLIDPRTALRPVRGHHRCAHNRARESRQRVDGTANPCVVLVPILPSSRTTSPDSRVIWSMSKFIAASISGPISKATQVPVTTASGT